MNHSSKLPVIVYIDASNIRNALKAFDINIVFDEVFHFFQKKYLKLVSVKYFEGNMVERKDSNFHFVRYYSILRKKYYSPQSYLTSRCNNCGEINKVSFKKKKTQMKSNIDVYLCAEMFKDAIFYEGNLKVILLTCDGDFKESIEILLDVFPNLLVSVIATPYRKKKNYLSSRLVELKGHKRYSLLNIFSEISIIKKGVTQGHS